MTCKHCTKCNKLKPFSAFYKNKRSSDGMQHACKSCGKIACALYRHTKDGLIAIIYNNQRQHSKKRSHPMPSYTLADLRKWIRSQDDFNGLYLNWVNSGYDKMNAPSCDRLNDNAPYDLCNLQLMTWSENDKKGSCDRKNGINNKGLNPIIQLTIEGILIDEYRSQAHAERETGVSSGCVSNCCNGKSKTAGGFVWGFAS